MRALALALFGLVACGPLMPIRTDAGSAGGSASTGGGFVFGGGSSGGGFVVAGGAAGGGSTAGGSTAGGSSAGGSSGGGTTAGGSGGGGLGPFSWSVMTIVPTPSASGSAAVAARAQEAWLAISPNLYRSTGAAFNQVVGVNLSSVKDLWVTPMGKVFIVQASPSSYICTAADCSVGANFVLQSSGDSSDYFDGLCGSGEAVYAIGNGNNNQAILFEFNGTGWTKISNDLGFNGAKRCIVGPSGEIYVLGKTFSIRYEGGGFTQENVDLMGQSPAEWNDFAFTFGATAEAFLVGGQGQSGSVVSYRFARRNAAGTGWTAMTIPMMGTSLNAIVRLSPNEYLAAGSNGGGTTVPKFLQWNGTAWVASTQPPNALSTVTRASVVNEREVFLVGNASAGGYAVVRGRR
ncbi:MAG: hypothetical protein JNM69_11490 [Archangium sp.]|nr:hypothetical protein [Archangium sp.]